MQSFKEEMKDLVVVGTGIGLVCGFEKKTKV